MNSELQQIAQRRRLSVVGVAKNCGKTTTLNSLLGVRRAMGLAPPGLMSIGVDGEAEDALLGTDKPSIFVDVDQWVVSAGRALDRSTARFEYVCSLGLETPLGEVFVCRVVDEGTAVLAGLRQRSDAVSAVRALEQLGGGPVWIDGAYGRCIGAHPDVATDIVVATGAVAGDSLTEVVDETDAMMQRLRLPRCAGDDHQSVIDEAIEIDRPVVVDDDGNRRPLAVSSAILGLGELVDARGELRVIAIPGLVSDRVVEELLQLRGRPAIVVHNWTSFHCSNRLWSQLRTRHPVAVGAPVRPVGLSYNPTSIGGSGVDARRLHQALEECTDDIPVFESLQ